jgi:hypothetical protein
MLVLRDGIILAEAGVRKLEVFPTCVRSAPNFNFAPFPDADPPARGHRVPTTIEWQSVRPYPSSGYQAEVDFCTAADACQDRKSSTLHQIA